MWPGTTIKIAFRWMRKMTTFEITFLRSWISLKSWNIKQNIELCFGVVVPLAQPLRKVITYPQVEGIHGSHLDKVSYIHLAPKKVGVVQQFRPTAWAHCSDLVSLTTGMHCSNMLSTNARNWATANAQSALAARISVCFLNHYDDGVQSSQRTILEGLFLQQLLFFCFAHYCASLLMAMAGKDPILQEFWWWDRPWSCLLGSPRHTYKTILASVFTTLQLSKEKITIKSWRWVERHT